jgi:segregation and condensation protein A
MSGMMAGGEGEAPAGASVPDPWESAPPLLTGADLVVDIEGFEGPLDLLLALARTHRIDLSRISMLALADQYLSYIGEIRRLNLELAADYLVMAAWLAYLKSRLLLPSEGPQSAEPSGEELAARLAFRLQRLEAMRKAAAVLMTSKLLGRDVFARGQPEAPVTIKETRWTAELYDLLKAYAESRARTIKHVHVVKKRTVWSVKDARRRLETLLGGDIGDWVQLDRYLERFLTPADPPRTVMAASFGATLELAREGLVELRQEGPFQPIYMRRKGAVAWERVE